MASSSDVWTREQLKLAFHLYCQLPFGRLHKGNPEIIVLAAIIGRSPSALAMKLSNFASLDPSITATGRRGLKGASNLDREVWNEFHGDWEGLAVECALLLKPLALPASPEMSLADSEVDEYEGQTRRAVIEQRVKQAFFRRAILSSYHGRCCITGVSDARLLVASHIIPWSHNKQHRLNPSNGLCLSALHDRAFDCGLITISPELQLILSPELKKSPQSLIKSAFLEYDGQHMELPARFAPRPDFLAYHRDHIYKG